MKSDLIQVFTKIVFVALLPLVSLAQITTKKVSFPVGKSSTVIQGKITGDQTIDYAIGANQGQKLMVNLTNANAIVYFNVLPPGSAGEAVFIGQNEGNKCNITLAQNGIYKIRVYQMRSTARRGEVGNYSLSIAIPTKVNSSDAKVTGTNYHATGELRSAIGSTPKTTKFGVIRSNGGGEVHATMSGRSKRIFVFSKGEWTCKSTNCKLTFAKISADEWELICNGTEKYYIPDAVIYGG
ncbi:MAG: hypothetical protein ACRC6O_07965 [Flavobacterium sp.]